MKKRVKISNNIRYSFKCFLKFDQYFWNLTKLIYSNVKLEGRKVRDFDQNNIDFDQNVRDFDKNIVHFAQNNQYFDQNVGYLDYNAISQNIEVFYRNSKGFCSKFQCSCQNFKGFGEISQKCLLHLLKIVDKFR